ncbi:MAG TPA: hypothetical protein VEA41_00025 [Salinarimonas sp.]|nr:hypothetical protein [Salinarimonas sp.]
MKKWRPGDELRRRDVVLFVMKEVRGLQITTSHPDWGRDETTALFCYLDHVAHPDDLQKAAAWLNCVEDYRAYNRARQADWYQRKAYGRGGRKLVNNRFAGAATAQGEPLEKFDPAAIQKRFVTYASRARAKAKKQPAGEHADVVKRVSGQAAAGQDLAGTRAAAPSDPNPF